MPRFTAEHAEHAENPWDFFSAISAISAVHVISSQALSGGPLAGPAKAGHYDHGIVKSANEATSRTVGRAYVKVSAPYNVSTKAPDYPDVSPLAKALIAANPQRILWGTNWPHPPDVSERTGRKPTDISLLRQTDDGRVFNQLVVWAPDPARRKTILVENPARLYGY